MKLHSLLAYFILSVLLSSCADNLSDLATTIQPTSDLVRLGANTYLATSTNVQVNSINARLDTNIDSLLLGNVANYNGYDSIYGQTNADILGQVACDLDFQFPKKTATQSAGVADSVQLVFLCYSYKGDMQSPLQVKVFEMNKSTFNYSQSYSSNIELSTYCDTSIASPVGVKVLTKANLPKLYSKVPTDSFYTKIDLSSQFLGKFTTLLSKSYANQSEFNAAFKGLYITTDFGSNTILYIRRLAINYYYHYKYKNSQSASDSIVVNSILRLPLNNTDGRIINRFQHPNTDLTKQNSQKSRNFISTPAGVYTRISLPLAPLKHDMDSMLKGKSKQMLNKASLDLEIDADTLFKNSPYDRLLLVKESEKANFFKQTDFTSVTAAQLGELTHSKDASSGNYRNYYQFDLARIINEELKKGKDSIALIAVPVKVKFNGSVPVLITEEYKVGGITLRSGQHQSSPMRLKLFYSGY